LERESALDELHDLLDGDFCGGCYEEMDVIGHEDERVKLIAAFGVVVVKD